MNFRLEPIKWLIIIAEVLLIIFIAKVGINHIKNTYRSYDKSKADAVKYTSRQIDLDDLRNEVRILKGKVEKYKSNVKGNQDQAVTLGQIQSIAKKTNINRIESVKPLEDICQDQIIFKQFELALSGEYTSVMKFINRLERSSPPFLITSMTLKPISQKTQYVIAAKLNLIQAGIIE